MKSGFSGIKPEDMDSMAKAAAKEAFQYSVPVLMNQSDGVALLKAIAQRG